MLLLLGSIILNSYLILSFKVFDVYKINSSQAIVYNYIACVITGSVFNGSFPVNESNVSQPWFVWAFMMGTVFVISFNMISLTARKASVAAASVANKLSMVIPVAFSVWLYNESIGGIKIAGIVIALAAVVLISLQKSDAATHKRNWGITLLIAALFLLSGLLDTAIKYVEQRFLNEGNKNDYLISAFFFAALLGAINLVIHFMTGKQKFEPKALLGGICIGIPNYFSIWCLVQVLKTPPYRLQSSAIIPVNNLGILLFCTLAAYFLFRERLSKTNWLGIVLSILAITLIAYGDKL